MLLKNIYSAGVTHDHHCMTTKIF